MNTENSFKAVNLPDGTIVNDKTENVLPAIRGERKFDIVIADPPYNIGKDFGDASTKTDIGEYSKWCKEWIDECLRILADDGIMYLYGFPEIVAHISVNLPLDKQRWLVWHYTNKTVPRLNFWQRSHETILCVWKDKKPPIEIDNIREPYTESFIKNSAGKPRKATVSRYSNPSNQTIYEAHEKGALPRDVIKIPALAGGAGYKERFFMCETCEHNVFPPEELSEHRACETWKHPTQKPSELTKKLLLSKTSLDRTPYLLVPFAGSGSELVVAQSMGIPYFATETNKKYVDFAVKWIKAARKNKKYALPRT